MTDDINPQAVPTREQIAQAIHDSIQRETPNEYVGPCYDTADAVLALFAQPAQAVGDEVDASQGHDFRDPYEDCDERCVRHPVVNGDPGGDEHQDCPE
jgi:hypothetical protein